MVKVSILVPVYNVEKYLRQCMDSVINQTLRNIEIICINDGSTDDSLSILREYEEKDSRVKIIDKENTGYGHSMNLGLNAAQGKYIGIVESDDFADAEMFERLYDVAESNKAEVVRSNFWIHRGNGNDEFREMLQGCPYEDVIIPHEVPGKLWEDTFLWTSIYRKDFLDVNKIGFNVTPGASYQDVGFTLKVLSCSQRMVLLREAYLHYRVDNGSASVKSIGKVYCKADEIASVWQFLEHRPKILEKTCCLIPYTMYCLYKADYLRVALDFKIDFLSRFMDEFDEIELRGYLNEKNWDSESWREMKEMIRYREQFFCNAYLDVQRKQLQTIGFLSEIEKAGRVYIYGAGKISKGTIGILQKRKIDIVGILVTSTEGNPPFVCGIEVRKFSSAEIDTEKDTVVVAVWGKAQAAIASRLHDEGVKFVLVMDEELYIALQMKER